MLLEIGYVGRPHGLHGEVVVELVSTVPDRLAPGARVECRQAELVVQSARPLPAKGGGYTSHWLVQFRGVGTREQAAQLTGAALRAEPLALPGGLWAHELIGSQVLDAGGQPRGTVVGLLANPASDLLELDSGALVPLRFVVTAEGGRVIVDVPEGLFDL